MKIHKYQIEITAEIYLAATSEQEAADKALKLVTRNPDLLHVGSLRQTHLSIWSPPSPQLAPIIENIVNGARLDLSEAKLVIPEIKEEIPF